MDEEQYYDLYLTIMPDYKIMYKFHHVTWADAKKYSQKWIERNDSYDYILMREGSMPWSNDREVNIINVTPTWFKERLAELDKEVR